MAKPELLLTDEDRQWLADTFEERFAAFKEGWRKTDEALAREVEGRIRDAKKLHVEEHAQRKQA